MRRVDKLLAVFCWIVALSFLALLIYIRTHGLVPWRSTVSVFIICCAGLFTWIGGCWWSSRQSVAAQRRPSSLWLSMSVLLSTLRRPAEGAALAGVLVTVLCISSQLGAVDQPLKVLPWPLVLGPVILGLFAICVLDAEAFSYRPFAANAFDNWPSGTERAVSVLVRAGWFGNFAVLIFLLGFELVPSGPLGIAFRTVMLFFLALLYLSLGLLLHFGNLRNK